MLALFSFLNPMSAQASAHATPSAHIVQTTHDAAQNNAVLVVFHQIEAIRRMSLSGGTHGLMRSTATHVVLIVKNDENAAVSAMITGDPVGEAGREEECETGCLVRAPPQATL
ncbi:MAG: hypothetical protein Q7T44_03360 [Parvibaculum sp.]|nr:hypothetical protein [Parvibaculum sp.]